MVLIYSQVPTREELNMSDDRPVDPKYRQGKKGETKKALEELKERLLNHPPLKPKKPE